MVERFRSSLAAAMVLGENIGTAIYGELGGRSANTTANTALSHGAVQCLVLWV